MLSFFRWVLFFIVLLVTMIAGGLFLGHRMLVAQGPLEKNHNVVIPRGAGPSTMAKVLKEEGVISHPAAVPRRADDRSQPQADQSRRVRDAGAHLDGERWSTLLQSGKMVQRRLTIPEGATTAEVLELLRKTDALTGDITIDVKEGDLLPETYFYSRNDTRDGVLTRMKEAMDKTLDEAWRKRSPGLPLASKRDALILASIIEKETAVPAERAKVAAVYINRLRLEDEARERSDDDLRRDRRQGHAGPRADARRPAVELALQHLRRRRPAAGADLQSRPRLDPRRGVADAARPLAVLRRRRDGRARLRDQHLRAQSQRRALEGDPAPEAGAGVAAGDSAASVIGRRHHRNPSPDMLPVLLALALLAALGFGIFWFLRANPSTVARSVRPMLVLLGMIGLGGVLILGVRFLPEVLPELFGIAGVIVTGLIARWLRQRPSGGFSQPGAGQRTEVRTAFLEAWIDHCDRRCRRPGAAVAASPAARSIACRRTTCAHSMPNVPAMPIRCACWNPISIAGWVRIGAKPSSRRRADRAST